MQFFVESKQLNKIMSEKVFLMRDDQCTLDRRIKELNDLCTEPSPKRIIKNNSLWNKTKVVMQSLTSNESQQSIYAGFSNKIEIIQKTIDTLVSEKELLVNSNNMMKKEISTLKSILSTEERKSCKHWAKKSDLNAIKIEMNSFKNRTKKNVKDLKIRVQAIEERLKSNACTNQNNGSNTGKLISQYDKLKMRLLIIERDMIKYSEKTTRNMLMMSIMNIKEEVKVPISNGYNGANCQPVYYLPAPQAKYPEAPPAPIPAPPKGPPAPPPEPQFPRYSINSNQLQAMAKELRKTGSDQVRKIPKRADMKIPSKTKTTTDQAADHQPPSASPVDPAPLVALPPVEPPIQSIAPPVSPVQLEARPPVESSVQSIEPPVSRAPPVELPPVESLMKSIESPVKPEARLPVECPMQSSESPVSLSSQIALRLVKESSVQPIEPPS